MRTQSHKSADVSVKFSAGFTDDTHINTDTADHYFHNDQHNLPRAAQTTVASGLKHAFWAINNGTDISELTSANLSKSACMIHLNTLLTYIFEFERETPTNAYAIKSNFSLGVFTKS